MPLRVRVEPPLALSTLPLDQLKILGLRPLAQSGFVGLLLVGGPGLQQTTTLQQVLEPSIGSAPGEVASDLLVRLGSVRLDEPEHQCFPEVKIMLVRYSRIQRSVVHIFGEFLVEAGG